ncbi:MAG: YebC/PmpR family DNA-binding transcriptional regulator [Caldilineales bacterium]
MSGHSKWSTIKRKKGAADAKRGALFTKLAREIQIAAREGGDPEYNFKLRLAVDKAKANSMPRENIERAIRRGSGLESGEELIETAFEGYGPGGVALYIEVLTDNRNRAVSEIRHTLSRGNGAMGESGSVAWQFEPQGYITVARGRHSEDELFEAALEAGAEDVEVGDEVAEIYTDPANLKVVQDAFRLRGLQVENAELTMKPKTLLALDEKTSISAMNLIENLEELDDVTGVYSNLEISEALLQSMEA